MDLKLGHKASAEQFGPRDLIELGVLAEEHGFDSATVSDHFQPWRHKGGHAPAADALPIEQVAKRWVVGFDPDDVAAQIQS